MGSVLGLDSYEIDTMELTDAGVERDANGNIIDPKELLKHALIKKWDVTKGHYGSLNDD